MRRDGKQHERQLREGADHVRGDPQTEDSQAQNGQPLPDDVIERYQRVDCTIVAAVSEMYATYINTRKVQKVARAMGIESLSKGQITVRGASISTLEVEELLERPLVSSRTPYLWNYATYVK